MPLESRQVDRNAGDPYASFVFLKAAPRSGRSTQVSQALCRRRVSANRQEPEQISYRSCAVWQKRLVNFQSGQFAFVP